MRSAFCAAMLAELDPERSVFLTGDLGFMALEPLRDYLGQKFINAGIAEQCMIGTAAGLASSGLDTWVYSIAPFCYARPFEQIRNDICLHDLPVRLVGNGGGYGYGVMGATHHAIEDYGVMLTLRGMRAFIPAFRADVDAVVKQIKRLRSPTYLRLGRCELPASLSLPPYAPWRRLMRGPGPVLVIVGPIAGEHLAVLRETDADCRPDVWVVTELPLAEESVPQEFLTRLREGADLWVIEEHVAQGSVGRELAAFVLERGLRFGRFEHYCAKGYLSKTYGSQHFHRRESGIDGATILRRLEARANCAPSASQGAEYGQSRAITESPASTPHDAPQRCP